MTATALRILGAYRAGARIGYRPGSLVAHITPATPLTPSGRHLPRTTRPVCGTRTRQLRVLAGPVDATARGLRFCRRCTLLLPTCLGRYVGRVITREDRAAAFGHLTVDDLTVAARWCQTVDDTHAVSTVVSVVYGPAPWTRPTTSDRDAYARWELNRVLIARRNALREQELSDDARAERDGKAEAAAYERGLRIANRRRDDATEIALSREREGAYLTDRQKWLVDHAM